MLCRRRYSFNPDGFARFAWALALGVLFVGESVEGGTLTHRTVALTGEPAPGTEDGVVFSSFTTGLNHWIMRPVIDDQGRVAFIALLTGDGVNESNQSGIWSEGSGDLSLVVRTGMQAPGTPAGVVFTGVPSDYLPVRSTWDNGDVPGPDRRKFLQHFYIWVLYALLAIKWHRKMRWPSMPCARSSV